MLENLEDSVLQSAFMQSRVLTKTPQNSILHINHLMDYKTFGSKVRSYVCQDCCSLQIKAMRHKGELYECFQAMGIPLTTWTFMQHYLTQAEKEQIGNF
jgi:hypothetical protein